ncbi:MAG: hypothetical protein NC102_09585 [Clostridium sp.]|nr:hypothetical protein [Clostridium sp.]
MKRLPYILLLIICAACAAGQKEEAPTANDIIAAKHAREDAARAISAPEGSMRREGAILHIKATQEAILKAGDTAAAAVYCDTAAAILRSAGLIY